jgi:hypothetical protein
LQLGQVAGRIPASTGQVGAIGLHQRHTPVNRPETICGLKVLPVGNPADRIGRNIEPRQECRGFFASWSRWPRLVAVPALATILVAVPAFPTILIVIPAFAAFPALSPAIVSGSKAIAAEAG